MPTSRYHPANLLEARFWTVPGTSARTKSHLGHNRNDSDRRRRLLSSKNVYLRARRDWPAARHLVRCADAILTLSVWNNGSNSVPRRTIEEPLDILENPPHPFLISFKNAGIVPHGVKDWCDI